MRHLLNAFILTVSLLHAVGFAGEPALKLASFAVDATPPQGSPLCFSYVPPVNAVDDPLSARGVVLLPPEQKPIVLAVVDWVGNYNGGYDAWREALAKAAGTDVNRVTMHTLHQHDAPALDITTEALLAKHGAGGASSNVEHAQLVIANCAAALSAALKSPVPVTHVGTGIARVEKFASNRRLLGPDGKVRIVRLSSTKSVEAQEAEEGTIDPFVRLVSFWSDDRPVAVLSYYATHPQSHYGKGAVSADTVGLARSLREAALPGLPHVHFNGAGGNVAAGKYNDGAPEKRRILAERLAKGMEDAWKATTKTPLSARDIAWRVRPAALPVRETLLDEAAREKVLADPDASVRNKIMAARDIAWSRRVKSGYQCDISALWLGGTVLVHMPGELFVEYQLAAHDMAPGSVVCMAAYGDCGPGYIGTAIAYGQGGYETGPVSLVGPGVEAVLMQALRDVLKK